MCPPRLGKRLVDLIRIDRFDAETLHFDDLSRFKSRLSVQIQICLNDCEAKANMQKTLSPPAAHIDSEYSQTRM